MLKLENFDLKKKTCSGLEKISTYLVQPATYFGIKIEMRTN